jgi:hypothetical protein
MDDSRRVRSVRTVEETLAPLRNFSISTADLVRAANGPPAFMRRKRHIEDLEASLRGAVAAAIAQAGGAQAVASGGHGPALVRALERRAAVSRSLRELNCLIAAHNCYYPIEANLPLDPVSRVELDRGAPPKPWQPLPAVTLQDVFVAVMAACEASSHVGKIA